MRAIPWIERIGRRNRGTAPTPRTRRSLIEPLESRTLLSVTIVNAKTATFTDVDGDLVTVSVSKGTLTAPLFTTAASGLGEQLQLLNLTAAGFAGANVTISVRQAAAAPFGNGLTNVGYINATGRALGKVTVAGDLGQIDAGSSAKKGVMSLAVFSLGRQGLASQDVGGSLTSDLTALGGLTVTTDIQDAFINVAGTIGNVRVGGSLIGGTAADSGSIQSGGNMGNVFIGQSLVAGNDAGATRSASVQSGGKVGTVNVGGSLIGGAADDSGEIFAENEMGKVVVGRDLRGGAGDFTGQLDAESIAGVTVFGSLIGDAGEASGGIFSGKLGNISIWGAVFGGTGFDSGAVFANGDIGKVFINQSLVGGDANSAQSFFTGYVEGGGRIASVFVGGSIIAGTNAGAGALTSGSIRAGSTLGSLTVNGSLIGNATLDVIISAGGTTGRGSVAIGNISVAGRVERTQILAGYGLDGSPLHGGAQIGKINVVGDWIASSVLAGVTAGADLLAGTGDDALIGGAGSGNGKIASITIEGQVFGTAAGGDHFGFVASQIGSFTAAGVKAPLTSGHDDIDVGGTDDVTILEL